jgi:vitamin B12 transporter
MKRLVALSVLATSAIAQPQTFTVTAEKIKKSTSETSNSISVITSEEIQESGALSVTDLIQTMPGVYISSNGTIGGISSLRIRGGDSGFSKIIVDGIEMNDPSNPSASFEINQLDISNIEQIEILRGSQSVIYGSEAIGGVVKITTKKSKTPRTDISLTGGSFNTKAMSFSSVGRKDKVTYSIGGSYYTTDGISSYNEKRVNNAEKDRYNRVNLKSLLEYKLTPKYKLSYQTQILKSDLDIDSFGADKIDKDNSSYDQTIHQLGFHSRHFQDKLSSELSFTLNELYRNSESTSTNVTGEVETLAWQGTHYFKENMTNIVGLEYEKQQSTQKYDFSNVDKKTVDVSSAFATSHIKLDSFFFDLGLRHDQHQIYDGHTTYKLGLGKKLPFNMVVKGSYATGFKSPTLSQLYSGSNPNPELKPTESKSYDLTFLAPFKLGHIEVTYFNYDYENQIDYDNSTSSYGNIDESEVKGVEANLLLRFGNLHLNNAFTHTKSEDKKTGLELLKTPEKLLRTTLKYKFSKKVNILTTFNYVGERFDFGQKRIPSYLVGDLVLNYENFQAKVANILDKEYEDTDTYGTPDRSYFLSFKMSL